MRRVPYLPNLLSSLRIALAPAMFGAAYSDSRVGFAGLLGVALISDALDGFLARRWRAETVLGRRLDRWGDGLTMVLAALGVFFLWPDVVAREWPWMLVALTGYLLVGLHRWWQPVEAASASRAWARVAGWLVPLALVPLIAEWAAWPFHAAAALRLAAGFEQVWFERGQAGKPARPAGARRTVEVGSGP